MKILFLLVVLTQNGAGDINVSFVNTDSHEQCRQKISMVENIFSAANIPIIESRCLQSDLSFSEFDHASSSRMIKNFYLIHLDRDTLQIKSMPDWRSCKHLEKTAAGQGKTYCSSSVQSLIPVSSHNK